MDGSEGGSSGHGDDVLIPNPAIPSGLRRVHESAVRHFDDALCLYRDQRARDAIPSLILSIEEHLKGSYMALAHSKGEGISTGEWRWLQCHRFKLKKVKPRIDKELGTRAILKICGNQAFTRLDPATGLRSLSDHGAKKYNQQITATTASLNTLKHVCVYHSWSSKNSGWDTFDDFPKDTQNSMFIHVLFIAKFYHDLLAHLAENSLELPCPRTCFCLHQIADIPLGSSAGQIALGTLQENQSVSACAPKITARLLNRCSRLDAAGGGGKDMHPLVDALSSIASKLPELPDGMHEYSSDDSSQARDGKPTMRASVSVLVRAQGYATRLERISINRNTCDAYDGRISTIIGTEKAIARRAGSAVEPSTVRELLSELGISPYRFSETNVSGALANARSLLEAGHLRRYPARVADSVRQATAGGWSGLDQQVRNVISALYIGDPAAIVLDEGTDLTQKSVLRTVLWDALCSQKSVYDGKIALL